jgi:hypothetical protein
LHSELDALIDVHSDGAGFVVLYVSLLNCDRSVSMLFDPLKRRS